MATNPYEQFGTVAPKAPPPVFGPPPKAPAAPTPIQEEDARIKRDKAAREAAEWEATHTPDGKPIVTPKGGDPKENAQAIVQGLGIDLVGDNDRISELIKKSTSGTLQRMGAQAVGAVTGTSTPGMEAIGELTPISADMTLQMTGGSLGAQISNADREFIKERMGDVANPDKTWNERLAAWKEVKRRLAGTLGLSQQVKVNVPEMVDVGIGGPLPKGTEVVMGEGLKDKSFDLDDEYQKQFGITRNQGAQVEAVLNANLGNQGITATDLAETFERLGIPTGKIDLEAAAAKINAGDFIGTDERPARNDKFEFDFSDSEKEKNRKLDQELKARGIDPESAEATAVMSAAQGGAMGGLDELAGILGGIKGAFQRQNPIDAYSFERDLMRRSLERSRAENPNLSLGAELATGLLSPVGVNKFRAARNIGDVAKAGAQLGGASGFLTGEGLGGSVAGAALGAPAGAALSAGMTKAGQAIGNKFAQLMGKSTQGDLAAQRAAAEETVAAGQQMDVPVRMADVRPELAGQRAQAKASQYGGEMVARAEEADLGAMENAMLKLGGGNITRDPFATGQVIQRGLENQAERSKALRSQTYGMVEKFAPDFKANPVQTVAAIDTAIESLKASAPRGSDEVVRALEKVRNDFAETGLSTASLQAQREVVRGLTNQTSIDMTRAEAILGNVLKIAGQELVGAMRGAGKTRAAQALEKANKDTAIYHDFRQEVAKRLLGPDNQPLSPERTASAIEGWLKPGASGDFERVSRVWKELSPPDRADFASAVASNMGRSRDGTFSLKLLINNLDTKNGLLSPRSAEMIFGREGVAALRNLKKLAEAKVVSQSGTNTSRTANVMGPQIGGLRRMMLSLLGLGAGDVTGAGAAYAADTFISRIGEKRLARLVTDTNVVKWIESLPETADGVSVSKALARLDSIAARSPAIAADIALLRDEVKRTRSAPIPARTQ